MNDMGMTSPTDSTRPSNKGDSLSGEGTLAVEQVREALWQAQVRHLLAQTWFDFASDGCLLTDLKGVIHGTNYAAAKLLGTRKEFLLGKPLGLFLADESRAAFYERLARLRGCDGVEQWEACVSRLAGHPRQVILTAAVHLDEEEIELRWMLRDVTELREAQQRRLQAERLAAIGQMVIGLAHEGRNALQRIQSCLAILTLRLQGQPENLDLLGRIQRAQDDLQHLFEDVRSYAVEPRLKRNRHDLRQSWREAWNNLASVPVWASAELREDIEGVEPFCQADPFHLEHVFRNLLENALSCGANPVRVVIHCRPASLGGREAICLRLHDNGPGIPAETRSRMFEPFFTTKAGGTGLGLAICKRIIESHGGQIEARSHAERGNESNGSGAEIVITLPRRTT